MNRRHLHVVAVVAVTVLAVAVASASTSAHGQSWPERPVTIIVPYSPGGNTDGIARIMAQRLGAVLGRQFVVENKPGANGAIAANMVARAPADGYTLFQASLPQIAVVPAMSKAPYDPEKDLVPISMIAISPFVLVVNKSMPVKTLAEFVDYVRVRPNDLSYASGSTGSLSHLVMALFLKRAGLEMNHVPYKGGGPALADVIANHLPVYFANLSEALPHAASGTIRLLAVSSRNRVPQVPDVPTVAESGYPGFETLSWNGLMAPAGTPKEVIDRLAREIALGVKDPKVVERLTEYGVDPLGSSPEEFATMIAADIALWSEAVKVADDKTR
jgi:tripartite-type tricarboxylate transporter receptor subunit TctC